jgi:hypothetical protein
MCGCEALQIGRTASAKMRAGDPEMIEKLVKAGPDRMGLFGFSGGCYGRAPSRFTGAMLGADTNRLTAEPTVVEIDLDGSVSDCSTGLVGLQLWSRPDWLVCG